MSDLLDSLAAGDDMTGAGEAGLGLLEVPASMATGTLGQAAGLISQGVGRLSGGSAADEYAKAQQLQDAMTYQPRTVWGQRALGLLGQGFESAANSAPIRAIADPISNTLLNMGMHPGDIAGLTGAAGLLAGGPESRLEGLPARIGEYAVEPNRTARQVASDYMASTGRDYNPPNNYVPADPARGKAIADNFEQMAHDPGNPKVQASYDALINESLDQYKAMQAAGVKVEMIKPGMDDPYAGSPRKAIEDVKNNNHLWVFPTEGGFGTGESAAADAAGHPLLRPTDAVDANGQPMLANDVFRAVHDYFGHAKEGVGFRANGEDNAWRQHAAMYSPEALPAMTTETRGQNSWVNFGPNGEANQTASSPATVYAQQKAGLLDPFAYAPFPEYADRYPPVPEPVDKLDKKKGTLYSSRGSDELTDAFMEKRADAQADIDAGNYKPYFDVDQRFNADPSSYAPAGNTLTDTLAKKQATIDKHTAAIDTPEARQRLNDAFDAGQGKNHDAWYAMGQLQHEYMDELGTEEGLARFKSDFADAMASTTAGQPPKENLVMAHYGNYLRANGTPVPPSAHIPYPISGQYMANNLAGYTRMVENGGMTMDSPKGHNFSRNLLGDMTRGTVDTRMSGLITPGTEAPPSGTYGIYENMLHEEAAKRGLLPANYQDVAWGGEDPQGKPMIQVVNEAIERTSRLTGLTPKQVVRRNMIRKMGPIFGLGGAAVGAGLLNIGGNDE